MLRPRWIGLLALAGLSVGAAPGQAEVIVRAPFVSVVVGRPAGPGCRGFGIHALGLVDVELRRGGPLLPGPSVPAELPAPRPVVADPPGSEVMELPPPRPLVPAALPPPRPLTLGEFATAFKPAPGKYEVVLVHPRTGRPVPVAFTLPDGPPPKMYVGRHELAFDYGRAAVVVRFGLRGRVRVSYR
jgi:hypothetical protein